MTTTATDPAADGFTRLGALLLGTGAVGLVATCIFYVLAGPAAALPGGAADTTTAITATGRAAGWMRAAGLAGMPSDVLLAVGALLFAALERQRGSAVAVSGWLALAIASALFIAVDAMVAMVLPAAASFAGGEAAYAGLRALFDVLFTIGAATAGAGALAAAAPAGGRLFARPAARWLMRAAGAVCLLASVAQFVGLAAGARFIGPGIALLALAALAAAYAASRSRIAPITAL